MRKLVDYLKYFLSHADMFLLFLCLVASVFGLVMIRSATVHLNSNRTILVQLAALGIGIGLYVLFSVIDIDFISERREVLFLFNFLLIAMLFTPLSVTVGGNHNWFKIPGIPFNIQPSEVCKVTFVILIARTMSIYQGSISKPSTIIRLLFHFLFIFGFLYVASDDAGSCLIYFLIFVVMLWTGGVHWSYFAAAGAGMVVFIPFIWNLKIKGSYVIKDYMRQRIMMVFDPTIDPYGSGIRWQTKNSLLTLTNGGLTGMGLFQGARTQVGALSQQHTDFIFSVIGEELGIVGCILVLAMMLAIVIRCIQVGVNSGNYMRRQVCVGLAAMLLWQVIINVGMCTGLTPVIGLTLPFISYGGSSLISLFSAMGIVSGIFMRPAHDSDVLYIRPPIG